MLDPWIIEEIRRREDDRQREGTQIPLVIELPVYEAPAAGEQSKPHEDTPPRGIAIIDYTIG